MDEKHMIQWKALFELLRLAKPEDNNTDLPDKDYMKSIGYRKDRVEGLINRNKIDLGPEPFMK